MTAEIYLGVLLGSISATIIVSVFCAAIWRPLQDYLMRRTFGKTVNLLADYGSCTAVPVAGVLNKGAFEDHVRHFDAQQDLSLAALDVRENGYGTEALVAAALAFRETTTPMQRKQMRGMSAFRKAQHETETGDQP